MKLVKISLLTATAFAGIMAVSAQAATVVDPGVINDTPDTYLQGAGATSIQIVFQQELNCLSGKNDTYTSAGVAIPVAEGMYHGATSTKNLNCASMNLQPNDPGIYIGTGSGTGRSVWSKYIAPQVSGANFMGWTHVNFAFSDGAISANDVATFRSTALAANPNLGNPLEIPLYVLPVAVAYSGVYGTDTNTGTPLSFQLYTGYAHLDANGNPNGGLRLPRATYCGIFNGTIRNWNDASIQTANHNTSLKDPNDDPTRWSTDGVPIRLVGRADSSGTTDVLSRHLAIVCGADVDNGGSNKFQQHAGGLPYYVPGSGAINLLNVDSNTTYKGTFSTTGYANANNDANHQSISGAYFNGTAIDNTDGVETPGKYLVADGSPNLTAAIALAPDKASPSLPTTLLNGKIGYVGTDYISPTNGSTVFAASLPVNGSATAYDFPTVANASAAVSELPPQTTAASGAYNTADARSVYNPSTGVYEAVDRANPLHWTAVFYSAQINGVVQPTLANPVKGYAITGTTQFLPYQCFANAGTRDAVANLTGLITGEAKAEGIPSPYIFDVKTFSNTAATTLGITGQSGIAPMPAAWNAAIAQTFLLKSAQASNGKILGQLAVAFDSSRNGYYTTAGTGGNAMWIQSLIPTTQTTGANALSAAVSNGACTAGLGA